MLPRHSWLMIITFFVNICIILLADISYVALVAVAVTLFAQMPSNKKEGAALFLYFHYSNNDHIRPSSNLHSVDVHGYHLPTDVCRCIDSSTDMYGYHDRQSICVG